MVTVNQQKGRMKRINGVTFRQYYYILYRFNTIILIEFVRSIMPAPKTWRIGWRTRNNLNKLQDVKAESWRTRTIRQIGEYIQTTRLLISLLKFGNLYLNIGQSNVLLVLWAYQYA